MYRWRHEMDGFGALSINTQHLVSSFKIKWVCGIIRTVNNKGGNWTLPKAHTCWGPPQQWPFLWNCCLKPLWQQFHRKGHCWSGPQQVWASGRVQFPPLLFTVHIISHTHLISNDDTKWWVSVLSAPKPSISCLHLYTMSF